MASLTSRFLSVQPTPIVKSASLWSRWMQWIRWNNGKSSFARLPVVFLIRPSKGNHKVNSSNGKPHFNEVPARHKRVRRPFARKRRILNEPSGRGQSWRSCNMFDDSAADVYGRIRAQLETFGTPIGPNDLMIAATALSGGLILVTHNTSEFSRVPGLLFEDWQTI